MQSKQDLAVELFLSGFNCAQSVLAVFCEAYGMDRQTALKATSGFGAGFRLADICGAASGAVSVIGLKFGQDTAGDAAAKSNCNEKTLAFLTAFRARNQSAVCRDLLGYDISTKDGYAQAQALNLFKTRCADLVRSAVALLEELGY